MRSRLRKDRNVALERPVGIEPTTSWLEAKRSSAELRSQNEKTNVWRASVRLPRTLARLFPRQVPALQVFHPGSGSPPPRGRMPKTKNPAELVSGWEGSAGLGLFPFEGCGYPLVPPEPSAAVPSPK